MTADALRIDPTTAPMPAGRRRAITTAYVVTAVLASALLFTVQPIVTRILLPPLGGSPTVWNTAMVFFQGVLLVGYLAAHAIRRWLPWTARPWLQIGIVAAGLAVLPMAYPMGWVPPESSQSFWILIILSVVVGLPFLGLSMLSPTLQGWLAETSHPDRDDPYFLYAAGNAGSVVGLLAYPLVLEPTIGLSLQARWWTAGYAILCGLLVACAGLRQVFRSHGRDDAPEGSSASVAVGAPPWRMRMRWVVLAAIPSGLLLAVTLKISTDVASIPLLWVVPLVIYLLTFVAAFSPRLGVASATLARVAIGMTVALAITMVASEWLVDGGWLVPVVLVHLAAFCAIALAVHTRLAELRPASSQLTLYYVALSAGGFIGGLSVGLVAPLVFDDVSEYALLVAAALIVLWIQVRRASRDRLAYVVGFLLFALGAVLVGSAADVVTVAGGAVVVGVSLLVFSHGGFSRVSIGVLAIAAVALGVVAAGTVQYQERSFFGVMKVLDVGDEHVLVHGTTVHGRQRFLPTPSTEPLSYYREGSGIERIMRSLPANERRFAMVGLGAGSLAGWGRLGDEFTFYEIDRHVVDIARDPQLFTHLADTPASIEVEVVDGRIGLERSTESFDLIVLDAFSSDSVPTHLLTIEAMNSYIQKLEPGGAIAVHVSNRYFDLAPVVGRLAQEIGWSARSFSNGSSVWVAVTPDTVSGNLGAEIAGWDSISTGRAPLWTDDYVNVLATLRRP